jgi:hypothetical protein
MCLVVSAHAVQDRFSRPSSVGSRLRLGNLLGWNTLTVELYPDSDYTSDIGTLVGRVPKRGDFAACELQSSRGGQEWLTRS